METETETFKMNEDDTAWMELDSDDINEFIEAAYESRIVWAS